MVLDISLSLVKRFVLIGTVHLDPCGEELLRGLLEQLSPAAISLEISEYAVAFRREEWALARRLEPLRRPDGDLPPGLQAVAAQLALPFEFRAAEAHARARNADLHLLGDDRESSRLLAKLEHEVLAPTNLKRLATLPATPLVAQVEQAWARARLSHDRPPSVDTETAAWFAAFEARIATRLEELVAACAGTWVHIGGWEHLHGLAQRLRGLQPEVRLLGSEPLDRGGHQPA